MVFADLKVWINQEENGPCVWPSLASSSLKWSRDTLKPYKICANILIELWRRFKLEEFSRSLTEPEARVFDSTSSQLPVMCFWLPMPGRSISSGSLRESLFKLIGILTRKFNTLLSVREDSFNHLPPPETELCKLLEHRINSRLNVGSHSVARNSSRRNYDDW